MRKEILIQRWIEMSTFSDVIMRSHPSNMPETLQLWSSPRIILHLKKFVDIHVALSDYKQSLVTEAHELGTPVTRPLMLHFPNDKNARGDYSEFMLGDCILMAPVFGEQEYMNVYLPGGVSWTHIWTGTIYKVGK